MGLRFYKSLITFILLLLASFVSFELGEIVDLTLLIGIAYAMKTIMKIIARLFKILLLSKSPRSKKVHRKIIIKIVPSIPAAPLPFSEQTAPEVPQLVQQQTVPQVSSIPNPPPPPRAPPAPTSRRAPSAPVRVLSASEFTAAASNVLATPKPYTTYRGAQLPNVSLENILIAKANLRKTNLRETIADFYETVTPSTRSIEQKSELIIASPVINETSQVLTAPKTPKVSEGPLMKSDYLVQSRANLRRCSNSSILTAESFDK